MIHFRRTLQIAPGRHDDAMVRSRELEAIWTDLGIVHATTTEVTGNCERLLWTKHWDSKDAYETGQRILQSDLVDLRGSGAYDHIKELIAQNFIERKRQSEGRSFWLTLSEKFHRTFAIKTDEIQPLRKSPAAAPAAAPALGTDPDPGTDPDQSRPTTDDWDRAA